MSTFEENCQLLQKLLSDRQYTLREITEAEIWLEDEKNTDNTTEVVVSFEEKNGWLKISNSQQGNVYGFLLLDGQNGLFRNNPPPVSNPDRFTFQKVYGFDEIKQVQKTRTERAGACDCLIIDARWRFFEFKTKTETKSEVQANENRTKAELQLARTLTFYREKAIEKNLLFDSVCDCIMVTNPFFPKVTATNINQATRFFTEFNARLIEIQTNRAYEL